MSRARGSLPPAGGSVDIGDFALCRDAGLSDVHRSAERTVKVSLPSPRAGVTMELDASYFVTDPDLVNDAGRAALAFS